MIYRNNDASETPEHNALQVLFLNEDFCRAFLDVIRPGWAEPKRHWSEAERGRWSLKVWSTFEVGVQAIDVVILVSWIKESERGGIKEYDRVGVFPGDAARHQNDRGDEISVELKTSVGEEYPSILRQVRRNRSRFLLIDKFDSRRTTREQLIAYFATANVHVVFMDQINFRRF